MLEETFRKLSEALEPEASKPGFMGMIARLALRTTIVANEEMEPKTSFLQQSGFLEAESRTYRNREQLAPKTQEPTELAVQDLNTLQISKAGTAFAITELSGFNFVRLKKDARPDETVLVNACVRENLTATDLLDTSEGTEKPQIAIRKGDDIHVLERLELETIELIRNEVVNLDSFLGEFDDILKNYKYINEPIDVQRNIYFQKMLKTTSNAFWKYVNKTFGNNTPYYDKFQNQIDNKIKSISGKKGDSPKVILSNLIECLKETFGKILAEELITKNYLKSYKLTKDNSDPKENLKPYDYRVKDSDDFSVEVIDFYSKRLDANNQLRTIDLGDSTLVIFDKNPSQDEIIKLFNYAKELESQIFFQIIDPTADIPKGDLYAVNSDTESITNGLMALNIGNTYNLNSLSECGLVSPVEKEKVVELKHAGLNIDDYAKKHFNSESNISKIRSGLIALRILEFPDFLGPIIKIALKKDIDIKTALGRHFNFLIEDSDEITSKFREIESDKVSAKLNLEACLLLRYREKEEVLLEENEMPLLNEVETLTKALDDLNQVLKNEKTLIDRVDKYKENFEESYGITFEEILSNHKVQAILMDVVCDDLVKLLDQIQNTVQGRKKKLKANGQLAFEVGKIKQRFLSLNALEYLRLNESIDYLRTLDPNFEVSPFNQEFSPKNVIFSLPKEEMEKLIKLVAVDDIEDDDEKTFTQLAFLQSFAEAKYIGLIQSFSYINNIVNNIKNLHPNFLFRGCIVVEKFDNDFTVSRSGNYTYTIREAGDGEIFLKYQPKINIRK